MVLLLTASLAWGQTVMVENDAGLRSALTKARPGQRIVLKPGTYAGGIHVSNLRGAPESPIVIGGADDAALPVIQGGNEGLHLVNPRHVELRNLVVTGARFNGINIDDGRRMASTAENIVLRNLRVGELDPTGNHDAIKLSGVSDFEIVDCVLERWGAVSGSGVDMVGCRRGRIERCVFRHRPETASAANTGVQAKGGTQEVVIRRCRFEHAGGRAVNIGGSTGLTFFRPPLEQWTGERWEARAITVEGNTFVGSAAPVAFVGVDGAVVRFNTIYLPGKWALRILQENRSPGFVSCRNGEFTDNIVVFRSDRWSEGGCNIGPNTLPDTFRFARNLWFCVDAAGQSRPRLPTAEVDGIYGLDPQLRAPQEGDFSLRPGSPAGQVGATALASGGERIRTLNGP
jgi:hypothetical protein